MATKNHSAGDFTTGYTLNGMAKCKQCKEKMEKGEFRYHPRCIFVHNFKTGHPDKASAFDGFSQLEKDDQKYLQSLVSRKAAGEKFELDRGAKAKVPRESPSAGGASPKAKSTKGKGKDKAAAAGSEKKKKAATKRKAKDAVSDDDEDEDGEESDADDKKKPAKKKAKASTKKEDKPAASSTKTKGKKAASSSSAAGADGVFAGNTFCVSGKFSLSQGAMRALIEQYGGAIADTPNKSCTFLVADSLGSAKTVKAQKDGIDIVTEVFITEAVKSGKLPTDKKYFLTA